LGRAILIWAVLVAALVVPVGITATSPQLAWRGPVYIAAGFAGIVALGLLLVQPLLIGGYLPGLRSRRARRWHGWIGAAIVVAVIAHVLLLWFTSPPDVVDVLLFRSPTPFSDWGAIAMWTVFVTATLAVFRRKLRLRPRVWRLCHLSLVTVIILGTVVHALLIEGTMGTISKVALCVLVLGVTAKVFYDFRPWALRGADKVDSRVSENLESSRWLEPLTVRL